MDDCLFMEAFDNMLKAWLTILGDYGTFPDEFCNQSSMQIFNTYLQCHLSPPDGNRGMVSSKYVHVYVIYKTCLKKSFRRVVLYDLLQKVKM